MERQFILDGVPLSKLANDETRRTQPSLNVGIPQYSAVNDRNCKSYFNSKGLPNGLNNHPMKDNTDSMMGSVFDKFMDSSVSMEYLRDRRRIGAGYTRKLYGGHLTVPIAAPRQGYHGDEGYRKNTPDLRLKKSVFDYQDSFENSKLTPGHYKRVQSAPATTHFLRQRSAKVYSGISVSIRATSAITHSVTQKKALTGPVT